MNSVYRKIAAVLAFIIGAMAIFAGGQVLLGKAMDYYVIDWLPIYNFTAGLTSSFIVAILIWKGSKYTKAATIGIFAIHSTVMLVLQTAYQDVVASDSIKAMTVRLIAWAIILALIFVQMQKDKNSSK